MATTTISVQMDTKDKEDATKILQKLGITMSGLINMTIKQVIMRKGIPFAVTLDKNDDLDNYFSKQEINDALKESDKIIKDIKNGKRKGYDNMSDFIKSLNED